MRSDLRLTDLETRTKNAPEKLMNAFIPQPTMDAIDAIAAALGCTKAMAVVALLNEGLAAFDSRRSEFPAPKITRRRRGRPRSKT
jgi:hypothetical protein